MSRETVIVILLCIVALMYVATIIYQPSLAKDMLEIFKYVVIAVISFYLGYAIKEKSNYMSNPSKFENVFKKRAVEFNRIGYVAVGFGVALILQHIICFGVDFSLISHEWVGIYLTIAGLFLIGLTEKYVGFSKGLSNIVAVVLLIAISVALALIIYSILVEWVQETLSYYLNLFSNKVNVT